MKQTILFVLLFIVSTGFAQEQFRVNEEAEQLFQQGIELYEFGSFENAAESFETALNINPVHQRTTASYMMAAKSWLQLHEHAQALFLMNNLLKRFPETEYAREAHFTLGVTLYNLNQNNNAAREFFVAIDSTKYDKLTQRSEELLDSLARFVLPLSEVQELLNETTNSNTQQILLRVVAEKTIVEKKEEEQTEPVVKIIKEKTIHVGVLLPLMEKLSAGPVKKAAEDILDGIKIAQEEFEQANEDFSVMLEVKDTERDSIIAKKGTKELAGNNKISVIIGELFSNITQACAPIANEEEIPLITPTANMTGLAAMGSYIFQANADVSMHGKALAQYAVNHLGMTTLAVLAPNNPMIKIITNDFINEAKLLGAKIIASEEYEKSSNDLSKQFIAIRKATANTEPLVSFDARINKALRKKIIQAGAHTELVDSLIDRRGKIPVSRLFGTNGLRKAESLKLKIINPKSHASNVEVPVYAIQGIFVPVVSAEDIGVIASQMTYYNIKTQLLGSAEWYDEAQLESQRRYLNGVIFCSDYFIDDSDESVIAFQNQLKRRATKYSLFGYDVMKMLLSCFEGGATSRQQVRDCLNGVQQWEGLHSMISLKPNRVNRVMQILQFKDGEVKRVREIIVD
ncbi:MAG: ABC transporter substrate-binding protein [Ignavibacteriales bacterium]|nr:ABC transporter substrate-binding protein [Ignavibacteriales bacterium]